MSMGLTDRETKFVRIGMAHFRYWAFWIVSKAVMGAIYLGLISEGARRLIPPLGQKLYKLVPFLKNYEFAHRIDAAHCFALLLLCGVWWAWTGLIAMWLGCYEKSAAQRIIVAILGTVFILVDCCLFYMSVAQWSWGGSEFSWSALLATVGYVTALLFICNITLNLKHELKEVRS